MMVVATGDELNYAFSMFYFGRKRGKDAARPIITTLGRIESTANGTDGVGRVR
jgi:hypothetical protein